MHNSLLIVDDEPNVLKSLKRLLLDTDYRIFTAESGEEGLKVFEENEINVVISDYRMPGMNGVEFLSRVKEKSPDTIRLILSGYADAVAIVDAINEGQIYRYITKPWNDQELLTTIMNTFDQYRLQKENELLYGELQQRNLELQELTKSLEEKVSQRTHDLEVKNNALKMAQNILNYLPVGVLGVDSDFTIVYMNISLNGFFKDTNLGLGMDIREVLEDAECALVKKALKSQKPVGDYLSRNQDIKVIWSPLPGHGGTIGVFAAGHAEKRHDYKKNQTNLIGAGNVE